MAGSRGFGFVAFVEITRRVDLIQEGNVELLDLANCLAGVQMLRADGGTVHDGVAGVDVHVILRQSLQSVKSEGVTTVGDPAISLQEHGRAQIVLVSVPPVAWTAGGAASAEDAFVEPIETLALGVALKNLGLPALVLRGELQERLY